MHGVSFANQSQSEVREKPKQLLWPIMRDVNSAINQSDLEANTCNRRQARENVCVQVVIGFGFASHWLRNWRQFCQPITELSKEKNQSSYQIYFGQ